MDLARRVQRQLPRAKKHPRQASPASRKRVVSLLYAILDVQEGDLAGGPGVGQLYTPDGLW